MRISDWSSDVCSSDLVANRADRRTAEEWGLADEAGNYRCLASGRTGHVRPDAAGGIRRELYGRLEPRERRRDPMANRYVQRQWRRRVKNGLAADNSTTTTRVAREHLHKKSEDDRVG